MNLDRYDSRSFDRGASSLKELLWYITSTLLSGWLPGSRWRVQLLRFFGANIGRGVNIKPGVRIKFPWRLSIGDYCWIGEDVWIDNLAVVTIHDHVCISQSAYLCTGSHDWTSPTFDLIIKPITVGHMAWVGAGSKVSPGVNIGEGAVLGLGSVATGTLKPWMIYFGIPAVEKKIRRRVSREQNEH